MQADILSPFTGNNASAFNLNLVDNWAVYDVGRYVTASVQALATTAWATAVITVYRSNTPHPADVFALEDAETLGPGSDITATLDVSGFRYLVLKLTTAEGSAASARIIVCAKY
jgi:hypothetical protein